MLYGRYEVINELGEGGMASVFLGEDPVLNRHVAIKVIHSNLATEPTLIQRFMNEAKVCAAISHSHVVNVFDFGVQDGEQYIVMEFIDGPNLNRIVTNRNAPLPWPVVTAIAIQMADGLAAAHAKGVIHRDIKPENLLLNAEGVLKIADFGIAHIATEKTLTQAGAVMGSPNYMTPEQVEGLVPSDKTDLFSMGSVLYFCLTGKSPFQGASMTVTMRNICDREPTPVIDLQPETPKFLNDLINILLQKSPINRTYSAESLHSALLTFSQESRLPSSKETLRELGQKSGFHFSATLNESTTAAFKKKLALKESHQGKPEAKTETTNKTRKSRSTLIPTLFAVLGLGLTAVSWFRVPLQTKFHAMFASPVEAAQPGPGSKRDSLISSEPDSQTVKHPEPKDPITSDHNKRPSPTKNPKHTLQNHTVKTPNPDPEVEDTELADSQTKHEKFNQAKNAYKDADLEALLLGIRNGYAVENHIAIIGITTRMQSNPNQAIELADAVITAAKTSDKAKGILEQAWYYKIMSLMLAKRHLEYISQSKIFLKKFPTSEFYEPLKTALQGVEDLQKQGLLDKL